MIGYTYSLRPKRAEGRSWNLFGDEIYKMMSVKVLLKILIFLVWLDLAFVSSKSGKVVMMHFLIRFFYIFIILHFEHQFLHSKSTCGIISLVNIV